VAAGLRFIEQRFFPVRKAERLANTSATRVITMASRNEQLPGSSTRPRHRSASIQGAAETLLSPRTLTAPTTPLLPHDRWSSAARRILEPASRPRNFHIDPTNVPRGNRTVRPALCPSICAALTGSAWFVLLASPDATHSDWVGKEIERWVATKGSESIRPVLTDGAWVWNAETNDFDQGAATTMHPSLEWLTNEHHTHRLGPALL
jgi:hypothetical protein